MYSGLEFLQYCQTEQGTQYLHFVLSADKGNILVRRNSPFLHQQQLLQKALLQNTQECDTTATTTTTTRQEMRPISIAKIMTGGGGKTEKTFVGLVLALRNIKNEDWGNRVCEDCGVSLLAIFSR